jgi:hypothetical protein
VRAHRALLISIPLATAAAACQLVTGLTDLDKVDCLVCDGGAPEAAPAPTCAHTFCSSFDHPTLLDEWQSVVQSPSTTIQLDTQEVKSPPASLLTAIPAGATGTVETRLGQGFATVAHGAHLELDVRVEPGAAQPFDAGLADAGGSDDAADATDATDASDADDAADADDAGNADDAAPLDAGAPADPLLAIKLARAYRLATVAPGDNLAKVGVALAYTDDGPAVLVATPGGSELVLPLEQGPAAGVWAHVRLDAVLDPAGAGSVKVTLDGAVVLDRSGLSIGGGDAAATQLELGLAVRNASRSFGVRYDNVTLDLE